MLHHVSIGVRNVERAAEFYDAVLGVLGYRRVMEFLPHGIGYGDKVPMFWVQLPHDQQPASGGNGMHIAFAATSRLAVDAFHRTALSRGGKDEGTPGPRPEYHPEYYGAFVRDPYGNKLEATLIFSAADKASGELTGAKSATKAKTKAKPKAKTRAKVKVKAKVTAARKPAGRKTAARGRTKSKGRKR